MTVTALNLSDTLDTLRLMLLDDPTISALAPTIVRGEPINEDPSLCPWIGLYKMSNSLSARTLGGIPGYRQQRMQLAIVLQQTHAESGEECENLLDALAQAVVNVLMADESLRGVVDNLDVIDVVYNKYGLIGGAYVQSAVIQFVGICNVR